MEYNELISTRESIRNYDPTRPVPKEILNKILEAGRLAPSAKNFQPWKFLLISSSGLLEKVQASYKRDWLKDAPHILIMMGLKDQAWIRGYDGYNSIETDVTIAMTHIILAAENEGVATCWIEAYNPELLNEALNPGPNQQIFAMTPLGYPKPGFKKTQIKNRKSLDEIVEFL
jgi:nitroreductase